MNSKDEKTCNVCEEQSAVLIVTLAKLDGVVLDRINLCGDCMQPFIEAGLQPGDLSAPDKYRARFGPAQRELRAQMEQVEAAFAATLARLMAERQLTQAQLAERIGVGQSAISMLLKRRCRPQRRTLGKLAKALGVPVDELWPGFSRGWRSGVM